jgi:hypothetical protein
LSIAKSEHCSNRDRGGACASRHLYLYLEARRCAGIGPPPPPSSSFEFVPRVNDGKLLPTLPPEWGSTLGRDGGDAAGRAIHRRGGAWSLRGTRRVRARLRGRGAGAGARQSPGGCAAVAHFEPRGPRGEAHSSVCVTAGAQDAKAEEGEGE